MAKMTSLTEFDIGNTKIDDLPSSFTSIKNGLEKFTTDGTPLCGNASATTGFDNCTTRCSPKCASPFQGDGICDSFCNSEACRQDGGDCTDPYGYQDAPMYGPVNF